jgi:hypothetical protein
MESEVKSISNYEKAMNFRYNLDLVWTVETIYSTIYPKTDKQDIEYITMTKL